MGSLSEAVIAVRGSNEQGFVWRTGGDGCPHTSNACAGQNSRATELRLLGSRIDVQA
jgi:hypothetical protein